MITPTRNPILIVLAGVCLLAIELAGWLLWLLKGGR